MDYSANTPHPAEEAAATADGPAVAEFDPVAVAARHDGWTPERQRAFIEELAACGVVREAAARVGMSEKTARRLRLRADAAGFNRAWDEAVLIGSERLHALAIDRAVNGTVRQRFFRGQLVGEERVFDNRLLIYLLGKTSPRRSPAEVANKIEGWEDRMGAIESEFPEPFLGPGEGARAPVWCDENNGWLTSFPPPPGFDGQQFRAWGDSEYCRTLSPDEEAELHAWLACKQIEGSRERDCYFDHLRKSSAPR